MSAPTNHWKLGAFVLGSVVLGLGGVGVLIAKSLQIQAVTYTSYFDEAVAGLDVGSPVTFRGVKIGNVTAIEVAPDLRHVEVIYSLGVAVIRRLGLGGATRGKETRLSVPPNLRVQLNSTGLTGIKYLQLDFFDDKGTPAPPELPFEVPDNYIPATPSTMKNVEDAIVSAVDQLPVLTKELSGLLARTNLLLEEVGKRGLPDKAAATLDHANRLIAGFQAKLDQLPVAALARDANAAVEEARRTLAAANLLLARLDGDRGLVASLQHTAASWGEVAGPRLGANVEATGRELREAAAAMRQFLEALRRDPEMLVKGRGRAP